MVGRNEGSVRQQGWPIAHAAATCHRAPQCPATASRIAQPQQTGAPTGQRDVDELVEAARAHEGGVNDVGPAVGGGEGGRAVQLRGSRGGVGMAAGQAACVPKQVRTQVRAAPPVSR